MKNERLEEYASAKGFTYKGKDQNGSHLFVKEGDQSTWRPGVVPEADGSVPFVRVVEKSKNPVPDV